MRLEWLEDILTVANTGSFSGAAEQRRLTQSAFSRRGQQIEQYVGVELFDRTQKPVRLRPTTLAQSAQIEQISAALRQLVADLRRGDRIASNKIVIASQHSLTTSLAPIIIRGLQRHDEGVYVRLRSANLDDCIGLLLSRQVDVAIVYHMLDTPDKIIAEFLETVSVGADRLIPVGDQNLADRLQPPYAEMEIPYIDYPADVFFGSVMASKIAPALDARALLIPKAETALTLAALEMASSGVGVAWVPDSVARPHIANARLVDMSDRLPSCPLQVRALRLAGKPGPAETALWEQLIKIGASLIAKD